MNSETPREEARLDEPMHLNSIVYLEFSAIIEPVIPTGVTVAPLQDVVTVSCQPAFTFPKQPAILEHFTLTWKK